jgi:hypothetical protein
METFKILLHITVAKEYIANRLELQFVSIIWSKIWPIGIPKHLEAGIIRCGTKKCMKGSVIVQKLCGCAVD